MTAAVWIKGILAEHYGVPVESVTYHTGGLKNPGDRDANETAAEISSRRSPRARFRHARSGEIDALYTAHSPPRSATDPSAPQAVDRPEL